MKMLIGLLLALISSGCAVAGPDRQLEAAKIWKEIGGHPEVQTIVVSSVVPTPAAVALGRTIYYCEPVMLPVVLRRTAMRYEMAKLNTVYWSSTTPFVGRLLWPVVALDAAFHGPVTELASWRAVASGAAKDYERATTPYNALRDGPLDSVFTARKF